MIPRQYQSCQIYGNAFDSWIWVICMNSFFLCMIRRRHILQGQDMNKHGVNTLRHLVNDTLLLHCMCFSDDVLFFRLPPFGGKKITCPNTFSSDLPATTMYYRWSVFFLWTGHTLVRILAIEVTNVRHWFNKYPTNTHIYNTFFQQVPAVQVQFFCTYYYIVERFWFN